MPERATVAFEVDGRPVEVPDDGTSLLDVLRERMGLRTPKDGCSPQGQCGCCTVLVDGQPRVACVTPARRVRGRTITTLDGLPEADRTAWGEAFCASGASQCGFCTPGIIMRLQALRSRGIGPDDFPAVEQALLAHLCRCTGWRTILEAWRGVEPATEIGSGHPSTAFGNARVVGGVGPEASGAGSRRDLDAASRRASIEGRSRQRVTPEVALGRGGFADDTAPPDALVAIPDGSGSWVVAESLAEARAASGKVQGRRTTSTAAPPLDLPEGDWDAVLRTSWVEPAYLELDASWCSPGGEPASSLANGGAFGGKTSSVARAAARELADRHGRVVRVVLSREDAVRLGPKRPPVAGGLRADGSGVLRVVRTAGIADAVGRVDPELRIEEVDIPGPPTSSELRAAGWAEAMVLLRAARHAGSAADGVEIRAPDGAVAWAAVELGSEPCVRVRVACGDPLDEVVLRSYCVGASHMALGWVSHEGLAVDEAGEIHDLTIRSFGILRAIDTPPVEVTIEPGAGEPVNGSDAVFVAVAAATWIAQGLPTDWPTGISLRR
jgi:xanthine dehydrogenase small subunit